MTASPQKNMAPDTVAGFGDEWTRFDQSELPAACRDQIFDDYFHLFPWNSLPTNAAGLDVGCGSGRWALPVAARVHHLHLLDASDEALTVARNNLKDRDNVTFHHASVGAIPLPDASLDFAYSLGVLHHVPDTAGAIKSVATKLKPGAPFLLYLYYAFDNRPMWFRALWRLSDLLRRGISHLPHGMRYAASQVIALFVYWPLARSARLLDRFGKLPKSWPLAYYRDKDFYVLRTDALDRFGTRLEQRFTKPQIESMLRAAGFKDIRFSDRAPYWVACATKG